MSPILVKCLVNGEILSSWWIYIHSFIVAASQMSENKVNCSLDNLEIILFIKDVMLSLLFVRV